MKIFIYGNKEILQNYSKALKDCGAEALVSKDTNLAMGCKGLLLAGGGDINPIRYGQRRIHSYNVDIKRDSDETELIRDFIVRGKPILGICRGIQIINVALKGTLQQDVTNSSIHKYSEISGDKTHDIILENGSFLYEIYGKSGADTISVNSAHHQAIDTLGQGLKIAAHSADGVIEAIENRRRNIYAVQFHPERMAFDHKNENTVNGRMIFDYFLSKC